MAMQFDQTSYRKNGFTIIPSLFSRQELQPLISYMRTAVIGQNKFSVTDQNGEQSELMVWSQCGEDFIGVVPRLARMINIATAAVGGAVYHWHSKITLKEPGQQGGWDWHQDYGHWYTEGCLAPDMMSIGIALDPMRSNNGPLKLLKGSHRLGRINHIPIGDSNGADPEYVERALKKLELYECHLEIGDAIVFHSNTLHSSDSNRSNEPRSFFLSSYNAITNVPWKPKIAGHSAVEMTVLDDALLMNHQYQEFVETSRIIHPTGEAIYGYHQRG